MNDIKEACNNAINEHMHILNALDQIMASTGEHPEGNCFYIDGHRNMIAKTFATKRYNLFDQAVSANNILEIGFNGGHSCFLYLIANPTSKIQLFDLGEHKYSEICFQYLSNLFPGRLSIVWGDSTKTLTKFQSSIHYDLIHIDGGHTQEILLSDMDNSIRLANTDTNILIDDISFHPNHMIQCLTSVVVEKLISGELINHNMAFYSTYHVLVRANKEYTGVEELCEHGLPYIP